MSNTDQGNLVTLTADIVSAHVANNSVAISDLTDLISSVHAALAGLGIEAPVADVELKPAVSIRASVKPDHIICLEDGKKLKMLKRHLTTDHGMTVAEYRAKWKLPADYPVVAPDYAAKRKALAIKIGLGRKPTASKPAKAKTLKPSYAKARATKKADAPVD